MNSSKEPIGMTRIHNMIRWIYRYMELSDREELVLPEGCSLAYVWMWTVPTQEKPKPEGLLWYLENQLEEVRQEESRRRGDVLG